MNRDDIENMIQDYGGFHDCIIETILIENIQRQIEIQLEDLNQCLCDSDGIVKKVRLVFQDVTEFRINVFSSAGLIAIYGVDYFPTSSGLRFEIEWSTDILNPEFGPFEKWVVECMDVKLETVLP